VLQSWAPLIAAAVDAKAKATTRTAATTNAAANSRKAERLTGF